MLAGALLGGSINAIAADGNTTDGNATVADGTTGDDTAPAEEAADPTFSELGGDSGDTAWMIVATALVLFMTIPGLSLFYGGLARRKNVLSILVQCFAITCLMTLLWTLYGYSLAYSGEGLFFGNMDKAYLNGVSTDTLKDTIPESVFFTFQMTFAIITPALIVGAFAERMKFSAVMIFMAIWFTISYVPVWHMVWGGGLLGGHEKGVAAAVDFAGGTVVHINAGIAGLVACIMLGKRKGLGSESMAPHNVPLVLIGAAMLWVGWFGFNAGSALTAGGTAGMAQLVTQIATATAAFTWMMVEWAVKGKPTAVGLATGAVAGLVAITPACGSVGPVGAIAIGMAAGAICYWASTCLKNKYNYDDSFDVFGVHAVGGIVGALLTGVIVFEGAKESIDMAGLKDQAISVGVTIVWSAVAAYIALRIAGAVCGGIRASEENETEGLDVTDHGESGYTL
jgi:Amt family ammonium transporter